MSTQKMLMQTTIIKARAIVQAENASGASVQSKTALTVSFREAVAFLTEQSANSVRIPDATRM